MKLGLQLKIDTITRGVGIDVDVANEMTFRDWCLAVDARRATREAQRICVAVLRRPSVWRLAAVRS